MSEKHAVKERGEPRSGQGSSWSVTWTCICGQKFTGSSGGAPSNRERIWSLARQRAETEFRKHLPID